MVVHTLVMRAKEFGDVKLDKYPIITMVSRLLRMFGEIYACLILPLSVAIGFLIIFASGDYSIYSILEPFNFLISGPGLGTFSGVIVVLWGLIASLGVFLVTYVLSELLILFTDIAKK